MFFRRALEFEELLLGKHKHQTCFVHRCKARSIRIPNYFRNLLHIWLVEALGNCGSSKWYLAYRSSLRRPQVKSTWFFGADIQVVRSGTPHEVGYFVLLHKNRVEVILEQVPNPHATRWALRFCGAETAVRTQSNDWNATAVTTLFLLGHVEGAL